MLIRIENQGQHNMFCVGNNSTLSHAHKFMLVMTDFYVCLQQLFLICLYFATYSFKFITIDHCLKKKAPSWTRLQFKPTFIYKKKKFQLRHCPQIAEKGGITLQAKTISFSHILFFLEVARRLSINTMKNPNQNKNRTYGVFFLNGSWISTCFCSVNSCARNTDELFRFSVTWLSLLLF